MMPRFLLGALVTLATIACGSRGSSARTPSESVATHPHATDRLYRLYRRQLTDSSPLAVEQAITCEFARLSDVLGSAEAGRRFTALLDTIDHTAADSAARRRARARLTHGVTYVDAVACDSLDAEAERELPLSAAPPRDSAARAR